MNEEEKEIMWITTTTTTTTTISIHIFRCAENVEKTKTANNYMKKKIMTATAMATITPRTTNRRMHETKVAEKTFHYPIIKYTFHRHSMGCCCFHSISESLSLSLPLAYLLRPITLQIFLSPSIRPEKKTNSIPSGRCLSYSFGYNEKCQ